MKVLNINYLADGDMVVFEDGEIYTKINTFTVFADGKLLPERHKWQGAIPAATYTMGEHDCAVVKTKDVYKVDIILPDYELGGAADIRDIYYITHDKIVDFIEKCENWGLVEAIYGYEIFEFIDGEWKEIENREIYRRLEE